MFPRPASVLVIEDHAHVAKGVERGLTADGYAVTVARDGDAGLAPASGGTFDLVVLDLMLPGVAGLDILGEMRRHGLGTPVLVLTARDTLDDRLAGFQEGADDYLIKPFALPELLAYLMAHCGSSSSRCQMTLTSPPDVPPSPEIDTSRSPAASAAASGSPARTAAARQPGRRHIWPATSRRSAG